jgi:hypothetical protein
MKSPFVQPEKSRVANVTIAKSKGSIAQILRMLRNKSGDLITTFLGKSLEAKYHLDVTIRLLIDHLVPIALVLYHLLNGPDVILCFRRWGLEIHSFPNRLTHDFCLMRL